MTVLARPARDSAFKQHLPGESLIIVSQMKRADFDPTILLKVRFQNGLLGVLLSTDVREVEPLAPIRG